MSRGKGSIVTRGDSFIVDFYYKGERFRPTLPGLSVSKKLHHKTAENILTQIQVDISRGVFNPSKQFPDYPKSKRFRTASNIKIEEKLNKWIEHKRRTCEASTWRDYRSAINHYLIPEFGEIYLSELTTAIVREWIDSLSLNISNQRINNVLIPLKAIYLEAYQDELIDRNPLDRIKRLPRHTPEPDPFSREEMEKILDACEGQILNIFKFAFWTGLRTSEIIALKWSDVSLQNKVAHIRNVRTRAGEKDRPKTDSSIRTLELLPPAIDALNAQRKYTKEGYIFLNPRTEQEWKHDGPLRKTAWKKAVEASGVKYRKMYNTRRIHLLLSRCHPVHRQCG